MGRKLYVGNLSFSIDSAGLERLFSEYGKVESASVVTDRESGRSRGFGFVEMSSNEEAEAAINALNVMFGTGAAVLPTDFGVVDATSTKVRAG